MNQKEILLNNILNSIDKQNWEDINLNEYIKHIIKLAEFCYHIPPSSYKISKLEDGNFGVCCDNKIEISDKLLNFRAIYSLTKTIFHETRHIQQISNNKLQIDGNYEAVMPVVYCDGNINMLDCRKMNIDPYDIYFTCYIEKDARDTSLQFCKSLFKYLNKKTKTKSSKHYTETILSLIKKDEELEKKDYSESMYNLIYNKSDLNAKVKNWLQSELKQLKQFPINTVDGSLSFQYWFFFLKFYAIITVYCDNEIKQMFNKFIVPRLKDMSVLAQYTFIHNFPFWNTTSGDIERIFAMYKKCNIPFSTLREQLFNYDDKDLAIRYKNFLQKQKNAKNNAQTIEFDNSNEFEK